MSLAEGVGLPCITRGLSDYKSGALPIEAMAPSVAGNQTQVSPVARGATWPFVPQASGYQRDTHPLLSVDNGQLIGEDIGVLIFQGVLFSRILRLLPPATKWLGASFSFATG